MAGSKSGSSSGDVISSKFELNPSKSKSKKSSSLLFVCRLRRVLLTSVVGFSVTTGIL